MPADLLRQIERFGATGDQLVDLGDPGPRALRFADLVRAPEVGGPPVVVESQGQPLLYVFDARRDVSIGTVYRWLRRIAFRGDANWVGVLRPGRLDIHPAILDEELAPAPTEGLPEGQFRIPSLLHRPGLEAPSVRSRLRSLLFASIKRAREEFELGFRDALALVGGALFWRFLVDRKLLDGLDPGTISPRARSWTDCFDNKQSALATLRWIDETFNGGLLKFETPSQNLPAAVFRRVAGDIAHKTDAHGQLSLPAEWAQVDFAHIPVGLLSEVYEAVAHDRDKAKATAASLFYTPRHLAEYVVDEVLDALRDVQRPRVLDPAAGAGVFLVAALRALVAREWVRTGVRPSRQIVRGILNEQLVGFDIDGDALRLAELALYLTAIELDPEDKPRPLEVLKFRRLRDRVLVEQRNSHGLGSLGPVPSEYRGEFDAVIGNPPWTALKKRSGKRGGNGKGTVKIKSGWAAASRAVVAERLGPERAAVFEFPDANPDLPFVYRAMEWAKPGAVIGLLTHARWLFGQSSPAVRARRDLLDSVHVTGILNASSLRSTRVWMNHTAPFCIVFAANESAPKKAAFQFVSPELDTRDSSQDRIRIDWRDAAEVEVEEVVRRPWSLKTLFRGVGIDAAVVEDLTRRGVALEQYLRTLGTKLANGYQTTASAEAKPAPWWMRELMDMGDAELEFVIDAKRLRRFSHQKVHRSRDPDIYRAPVLIVRESMVVDRLRPRSGLALRDVAYDERFDGVSFATVHDGLEVASYLQVIFQSSLFTYALLMLDGQFGVEREVVHLETIKRFPVIPWSDLTSDRRRGALALSKRLQQAFDQGLQTDLDSFVARLYHLTDVQQHAVRDAVTTALPTKEALTTALRATTRSERSEFARVCEHSLREVLSASELTAHVELRGDLADGPWRFMQIDRVPMDEPPKEPVELPMAEFLLAADQGTASLVSLRVDGATTLVGLLDRYRYWTRTRARLLASALLAGGED